MEMLNEVSNVSSYQRNVGEVGVMSLQFDLDNKTVPNLTRLKLLQTETIKFNNITETEHLLRQPKI